MNQQTPPTTPRVARRVQEPPPLLRSDISYIDDIINAVRDEERRILRSILNKKFTNLVANSIYSFLHE